MPSGTKGENCSPRVPRSAPFMKVCQIDPGSIRPNTGRPAAFLIGSLWSVPTQTAVDIDGV